MNWLRNQWAQLLAIYRSDDFSRYLRDTAVAFSVIMIASYVLGRLSPTLSANVTEQFTNMVADSGIADESGPLRAISIFIHNVRAAMTAVLYGFVPYLFLPAVVLGTNSMILGFVGAHYVNSGRPILLYLAAIVPHGIFEIPALVLVIACGLYLCACLVRRIRTGERQIVKQAISRILRLILFQILPLLFLAALIEAYVTGAILQILQ